MNNETVIDLQPPILLRHPHLQNLVSSLGLRHNALKRRTQHLTQHTNSVIVDGGDGVRLTGEISVNPTNQNGDGSRLVILIHGWEGCSQSAYMISAALALFNAGFNVFRLNLRDHGDSHQLNEGLFNSTLISEVLSSIADIQQRWPHQYTFLAGFSLGGNFALRVGSLAPSQTITLNHVAAVCPVIDPGHTLRALENTVFFYEQYFVRRWRNSLLKKLDYFPHYNYRTELMALNNLRDMHGFFVPRFTPFNTTEEYFDAYAIKSDLLNNMCIPTHIITSADDPITKAETLPNSINNSNVVIERPRYGSHCAFLQDYRLTSWLDDRLIHLFNQAS